MFVCGGWWSAVWRTYVVCVAATVTLTACCLCWLTQLGEQTEWSVFKLGRLDGHYPDTNNYITGVAGAGLDWLDWAGQAKTDS